MTTAGPQLTATLENVQDVLKALKDVDPELRKATIRKMRTSGKIAVQAVQERIPDAPPMSGWRTGPPVNGRVRGGAGWPGWAGVDKAVKVKVGTTMGRKRQYWPLLAVEATRGGPGAMFSIFEGTGRRPARDQRGGQFRANLDRIGPYMQRALWPGVNSVRDEIRGEVQEALREIEREINGRID